MKMLVRMTQEAFLKMLGTEYSGYSVRSVWGRKIWARNQIRVERSQQIEIGYEKTGHLHKQKLQRKSGSWEAIISSPKPPTEISKEVLTNPLKRKDRSPRDGHRVFAKKHILLLI